MPIYEFTCPMCGMDQEEILPYRMDIECPKCSGEILMSAKVSIPSISFKGTGWAKEGYVNQNSIRGGGRETPNRS